MKKVNENPSVSLKALLSLAGMQKKVHINSLVFIVAPRINAAGRMDDAKKAVQLFIEEDYDKAMEYAELLHNDNTERKEADSNITDEALSLKSPHNLPYPVFSEYLIHYHLLLRPVQLLRFQIMHL